MVNPLVNTTPSANKAVVAALNEQLSTQSGPAAYQLSNSDLEVLHRFHERTALTIGPGRTRFIYQKEGFKLALRHPFLMHIAITVTMMHTREDLSINQQSTMELYHWYQGTSQFNRKLSGPLTSSERDAIWIAAVLLGCSTIAHVDGDTPEQVWPLKRPSSADLDWLKISWGKKEAWRIADIYRPDSTLRELQYNRIPDDFLSVPSDQEVFRNLPRQMALFCGLSPESTPATNPCHVPGAIVARLVPLENNWGNILRSLTFLGHMPLDFRTLLEAKDPRALVILLWYETLWLGADQWWMKTRCFRQTEAIMIYLERHHGDIPHLQEILEVPRAARMEVINMGSKDMLDRPHRPALPCAHGTGSSLLCWG